MDTNGGHARAEALPGAGCRDLGAPYRHRLRSFHLHPYSSVGALSGSGWDTWSPFALRVYVGVTETFAGVQSAANSYTSLRRSDTPATTSGANRPRRSGLFVFGCRSPPGGDCYVLPASRISLLSRLLVCRLETASLQDVAFAPPATRHPPIFASFGDVGAHEAHAAARSLHRMLAHLRIAPPHATSESGASRTVSSPVTGKSGPVSSVAPRARATGSAVARRRRV